MIKNKNVYYISKNYNDDFYLTFEFHNLFIYK